MNIAAIKIDDFEYFQNQQTFGYSDSARNAQAAKSDAFEQYSSSVTTKDRNHLFLEKILSIDTDLLMSNWDGYGAIAINPEAIENALNFLFRLNIKLPLPELTPEPDGEIALEWYGEEKSVFSISFGKSEIVSYSGIFKDKTRVFGKDKVNVKFFEEFIKRI